MTPFYGSFGDSGSSRLGDPSSSVLNASEVRPCRQKQDAVGVYLEDSGT